MYIYICVLVYVQYVCHTYHTKPKAAVYCFEQVQPACRKGVNAACVCEWGMHSSKYLNIFHWICFHQRRKNIPTTTTYIVGDFFAQLAMVFSVTKMENEAGRGVLLKKHWWIICSSPREDFQFFCNITQNTLITRVFLVLPKIHSLDARVSLEERFVKCRMHERKHIIESFIY